VRKLLARAGWLGMLGAAVFYAGQANRSVSEAPRATLRGRAIVFENINRKPTTNPVRNLQVYLFSPEATRPFEELQQKCRRALARPKAGPVATHRLCERALGEAFELIPTLAAMAKAKTGADGSFSFDNVEPGRPYHVIGIKPDEEGRPIIMVVKTPCLHPGQRLTLALSENDPWTGPVM